MIGYIRIAFVALAVFVCALGSAQAQEVRDGLTWYTDVNKAHEVSGKSNKPIFAFFTGSDWCGWCHRLQKNVFAKPAFKDWAKKNVILLELDFPRNKQLPENIAKQNNDLQQFFSVRGYPTVWIFNMTRDASNKYSVAALGSLGYPRAEPGQEVMAFLQSANEILKSKAKPQ